MALRNRVVCRKPDGLWVQKRLSFGSVVEVSPITARAEVEAPHQRDWGEIGKRSQPGSEAE